MTTFNSSSDPALPANYEILGTLGEGAMALVYKARHKSVDRIVAIKTLKTAEPELMSRFAQEMKVLARLRHKNIIEAIDCFENALGQSFFVMEYIQGKSLDKIISSSNRCMSEEDIAGIVIQVLDALDHAHSQQIIHRDLKPANIMVGRGVGGEQVVKVLDFGIARLQDDLQRLTAAGQVVGSPLYMSPEQCMGRDVGPRSDLYSVGILLYELTTGALPYVFPTASQTMAAHCNPNLHPVPLDEHRSDLRVVDHLNKIVQRALETDPDARYQTAKEFKRAIEHWIQCVGAGSPSPLPQELAEAKEDLGVDSEKREELAVALRDIVESTRPNQRISGDSPKPLRNFLIGLTVSLVWGCLVVVGALNYKQCVEMFKSASRTVNSVFTIKPEPVVTTPKVETTAIPEKQTHLARPYSRLDSIDDTVDSKAKRIE